jgi:thioesterase domain-containing protein
VTYEIARQLLDGGDQIQFLGLLDPTDRQGRGFAGGGGFNEVSSFMPRVLRQTASLCMLVSGRLNLYLDEFNQAKGKGKERFRYIAGKLRAIVSKVCLRSPLQGTKRELHQLEVYRANLTALDGYRRKPLSGDLQTLEIFETVNVTSARLKAKLDWREFWSGALQFHSMPGKDSGDMLSDANVCAVAQVLKARLQVISDKRSYSHVGDGQCA